MAARPDSCKGRAAQLGDVSLITTCRICFHQTTVFSPLMSRLQRCHSQSELSSIFFFWFLLIHSSTLLLTVAILFYLYILAVQETLFTWI